MVQERRTDDEIVAALAQQESISSKRSLQRRLKSGIFVTQGCRLNQDCIGVEAPITFQVFSDLWPVPITNHVPYDTRI
jgi:hypothetical protein